MSEGGAGGPRPPSEPVDEHLDRLLDELPDAVVVIDATGIVKWANTAAERLFARTRTEAVGLSGLDLVHPDDLELVLRSLETVQSKEVGTAIEVRVKAAAGWRLVELLGSPVSWLDTSWPTAKRHSSSPWSRTRPP
jgi:PAS domain S-box-containing protein